MDSIAFDDVPALEARVSEDYGPFGDTILVSQEMINEFADLTGDNQWIHVDVERCKAESPFGTTIAHGFLTLALLPALNQRTPSAYVIEGASNVVNYGSDALRFLSPVPAGSKLCVRKRLKAVEATPKGTRIVEERVVHIEGIERPAVVYEMILLYQAPRG